ncbi:hypothetical protein SELMODRAFT_419293 [Selaginella moellendorffii]|uniref:Cytochrome P450-dependent monooxygenase n=1 Tax=Selaginella moellendorffii TaxID=88036 RepID=D8S8G4_SELML|nr:hypothetical protein SELMODRAFT_419293 [Selaginella moellendorffii]
MKAAHKKLDKVLQRITDEHKSKLKPVRKGDGKPLDKVDNQAPDLIDVMLSLDDFDNDCLKGMITDVLAGGTDTAAIAMEWALSELIRNQPCMAKAQDEIDLIVGGGRDVNEDDLSKLKYLKAVVKETFRLHPPAPLRLKVVFGSDGHLQKKRIEV